MTGQIRIRIRYHDCVGDWFDYLLVSPEEMEDSLEGTGWRVQSFITGSGPAYIAVIHRI